MYVTGWQIELGNQVTPFEHRSFGEELELCQRYYKDYGRDGSSNLRVVLTGNGGTNPLGGFIYAKSMRASPTFNYYGSNTDGGNFNVQSPANGTTTNTAPICYHYR